MAREAWLLFIIHLFIHNMITFVRGEVLLMRRQESNDSSYRIELSCYYNGPQSESVGLGWITPKASTLIPETHERWRHTTRVGLVKGHFEFYGHIWQSTTALMVKPNVYPPVLDERWNDFPTVLTPGTVEFSPAVRFNTDRIHVSILARQDAHIALYSGSNPYTSASYWITLDEWMAGSTFRSSIRKCTRGLPRSMLPRFPDCAELRVAHQGLDVLQRGEEWVHITIQLSNEQGGLKINVKMGHSRDDVAHILAPLTWIDRNPIRELQYISFRTKDTPGRWKVHDYRLVIHNGKADGEGFNVFELSQQYRCCLQLYYFFRPDMGVAEVRSKSGFQKIQLPPTNGTWRVLKVNMDMFPPSDHIHFKPPLGHFDSTGPAFAISQPFRICGDDEFFVSKIVAKSSELENAKCVNMKTADYAVLSNNISQNQVPRVCPEKTFSKSCNITCGRVVGDSTCRGKIICEKEACSCIPGYKPTTLWNTTCTEQIPSDEASVPLPEDHVHETDSIEEEVDLDDEGYMPFVDADESSKNISGSSSGKDAALIILSVLLFLILVGGVLAVSVWLRRTKNQTIHSIGVRWRGNSELLKTEEDDDTCS